MTPEEKKALKKLENAFKSCRAVGLNFAGMDGQLLYATKSAYEEGEKLQKESPLEHYSAVAEANKFNEVEGAGIVNTHNTYDGSGGY